jgi:outer membrane protein OmpA-like peptidoglycan-associated protein
MMIISKMRSGLYAGPVFIAVAIAIAGAGAVHAAGADLVRTFEKAVAGAPDTADTAGLLRVKVNPIFVPIPIQFVANQTALTPTGEHAMQELIEAAKQATTMTLVGHAAPRGTHEDNVDLSRRRVRQAGGERRQGRDYDRVEGRPGTARRERAA